MTLSSRGAQRRGDPSTLRAVNTTLASTGSGRGSNRAHSVHRRFDEGPRLGEHALRKSAKSSLADTPASVSVFTKEFIQDVGLTELNELIDYSVNAQLNFNDTGAAIEANPYVNATSLTRKIDIRGIPLSQALDCFHSITPHRRAES